MKIITRSSKVIQGTGEAQSATVSYDFGVKGSEQKRVCDRSIVLGTVRDVRPARFKHAAGAAGKSAAGARRRQPADLDHLAICAAAFCQIGKLNRRRQSLAKAQQPKAAAQAKRAP